MSGVAACMVSHCCNVSLGCSVLAPGSASEYEAGEILRGVFPIRYHTPQRSCRLMNPSSNYFPGLKYKLSKGTFLHFQPT